MKTSPFITYNVPYLLYILLVIVLDGVGLYTHIPYVSLVAIVLAWIPLAREAVMQLRHGRLGTDFFLSFATIIALIGKQETAIMLVLLIMLIAHYAEMLIEQRTTQALEKLIHLLPNTAVVRESDGKERVLSIDALRKGMQVIVKTGSRIPADGTIIEGQATINEAPLTGESVPQDKGSGSTVFAGSFIEAGSVVFTVEHTQQETLFGKMTSLLESAQKHKARITIITEKIVFVATPVLLVSIIGIWVFTKNFDLIVTLLIFGSPLELSLVTPLTVLAGSVAAFKEGILIKNSRALELLASVDVIIFDKTGTLTLGEPTVSAITSFSPEYTDTDILTIAAIAEKRADHVIAKAILHKAHDEKITLADPQEYVSLVGHGVIIHYNNIRYYLGNQHFIEAREHGNSPIPEHALTRSAYTDIYLAKEGVVIGKISVSDTIRPDARNTIHALKKSGVSRIMLVSGDKQDVVDTVAQDLGITEALGGVFPDQKLTIIKDLQDQNKIVAMVGDGINDAAALKQAHVGIAMGAMGMEPAIEAADIVLLTNTLHKVYFVRMLAQRVFRVVKQNIFIGFLTLHALGIILTFMHIATPVQAAFVHALSDIFILLNASKLVRFNIR